MVFQNLDDEIRKRETMKWQKFSKQFRKVKDLNIDDINTHLDLLYIFSIYLRDKAPLSELYTIYKSYKEDPDSE